ncbi:helix-turn-helix transcriptional regulator [Budviciaceae bacterium CWB-B4]|uniref:Helix-turn-helix transcriptional regulator n=1 Tax=Limnobaculum xujianqingii TaxID=2738837 RepID=A0A9D7AGE3_9GAMM|nr:S24 family peptidase [Limnobaculum xujianqingii]MBK5072206.1 helix-turn-helix transcriptional regulator [Limnobaculum xujianqingii]MBK5175515.1 helix-turn-helix transcriptional regulator [Limnobaculum xujianqingii]
MNKYEIRRQKLIELRDKYCGGKISTLAEKMGKNPSYVSRLLYEEGKEAKRNIADRMVSDIESAFRLPRGWLDGMLDDNNLSIERLNSYRVDVLDVEASAGHGVIVKGEFIETIKSIEYATEYAKTMFGGRPANTIKTITVKGDSMKGTIDPGDQIFIDMKVDFFDGDGIYVFVYGETLHVKRLQMQKDRLAVLSDNEKYDKWFIDESDKDKFFVSGKVLLSQSQAYKRHG